MLPLKEEWVKSLVWELRFYITHGVAKKIIIIIRKTKSVEICYEITSVLRPTLITDLWYWADYFSLLGPQFPHFAK